MGVYPTPESAFSNGVSGSVDSRIAAAENPGKEGAGRQGPGGWMVHKRIARGSLMHQPQISATDKDA